MTLEQKIDICLRWIASQDTRNSVAFDRNEWVGKSKRHPYYRCHLDFGRESYEVIGNIHDNPKLLEEKA